MTQNQIAQRKENHLIYHKELSAENLLRECERRAKTAMPKDAIAWKVTITQSSVIPQKTFVDIEYVYAVYQNNPPIVAFELIQKP
jgi:hypothetical protein